MVHIIWKILYRPYQIDYINNQNLETHPLSFKFDSNISTVSF